MQKAPRLTLCVVCAVEGAIVPKRPRSGDVGYDLHALRGASIDPGERALIDTGIKLAPPDGTYCQIKPRSSLAVKGIDVGAGVVDPAYRNTVHVLLINNGKETFHIHSGDRIAQAVLLRVETPEVVEVKELDATERGEGGFGSTGK